MLDPRIYRMGLVPLVFAVIVLAFSLGDQQAPLGTSLAPDAFNGQNAYGTMLQLARQYPQRRSGSAGDYEVAGAVAGALRQDGFTVTRHHFQAQTADGPRELQDVVGTLAGQRPGTIAVVAHRDAVGSPAQAELSGTAVMLELARLLAGETQQHTFVLASVSGAVGAAGAAHLARELPQPVDAVVVLGDLAGVHVRQPVVVPWSDGRAVAPPLLRNTLGARVSTQAGLAAESGGLGGQIAHLAFPMSPSEQAPFLAAGQPAVLVSLAGERAPGPDEPVSLARISGMGRAVLQALHALDTGSRVPAPSTYLLWSGKVVPAWAIRLLVLVLILPVGAATLDGLARVRRRGHSILRGAGHVLLAAVPFLLAALVVALSRLVGLIGAAPASPVAGGAVALGSGGAATLALAAGVLIAGLTWLRPRAGVLPRMSRHGERGADGPDPDLAAGLLVVLCLTALITWWANPFAGLLMIPALHLWMWMVAPRGRLPAPALLVMLLAGLCLPALVALYDAMTLGLGPIGVAWSWALLLAGGGVGWLVVLEWSLFIGCALAGAAIAVRAARAPRPEPAPVTVRGPVTYAGPGSLGGTESALRR